MANARTKSSGLIWRTAVKGMKRWQGAWPPQNGAHDASTRARSQSATRGGLDGQPSTCAMPLNDTSQGCSPAAAASAASALGSHACSCCQCCLLTLPFGGCDSFAVLQPSEEMVSFGPARAGSHSPHLWPLCMASNLPNATTALCCVSEPPSLLFQSSRLQYCTIGRSAAQFPRPCYAHIWEA